MPDDEASKGPRWPWVVGVFGVLIGALLTLDRQHIADGLAEAKSDRTRLWEETRRLGDQLAEQREAVAYIKGWLDAMKEQK